MQSLSGKTPDFASFKFQYFFIQIPVFLHSSSSISSFKFQYFFIQVPVSGFHVCEPVDNSGSGISMPSPLALFIQVPVAAPLFLHSKYGTSVQGL